MHMCECVCVYFFTVGGLGSVVARVYFAFSPTAPPSSNCVLCPGTHCPPRTHVSLAPWACKEGVRTKEAPGTEAGETSGTFIWSRNAENVETIEE